MKFDAMKDLMDRLTAWRTPGNAISIWKDGKEVFTYQSGYADVENKIPMTPEHYINIYSCSKVTAVTAALQLYEKGYFLLDDPLYEFIPEYREMYIRQKDGDPIKAKNPITMRHLFTMTSGLTYNCGTPAFQKARELTDGRMDTLTVIKCLAKDPLSFEPGEKWQYSLSHDVLAGAVEAISGKKFRDYVKENIFDPLDMSHSMYHNESVWDKMAEQYMFVNSKESDLVALQVAGGRGKGGHIEKRDKTVSHVFGPGYDAGGAGITTTVSDYAKFCAALAGGGLGATGERILSAGTVDLLSTNQLNEQQFKPYEAWLQNKGYGYGLGVRTLIDKAASGTTGNLQEFGWGGAAGASVYVDTKLNLGVFYGSHMLNPYEEYYQPRVRNVMYTCLETLD